jgi:hypothetical protein
MSVVREDKELNKILSEVTKAMKNLITGWMLSPLIKMLEMKGCWKATFFNFFQ